MRAAVAVACFIGHEQLITHGPLRAHAIYDFVPGILRHFDAEAVPGLIAPRALLALTGDSDPTSPPGGVRMLESKLKRTDSLYQAPERFRSVICPDTGHRYLPEMKREMAAWLERWPRAGPDARK